MLNLTRSAYRSDLNFKIDIRFLQSIFLSNILLEYYCQPDQRYFPSIQPTLPSVLFFGGYAKN